MTTEFQSEVKKNTSAIHDNQARFYSFLDYVLSQSPLRGLNFCFQHLITVARSRSSCGFKT